MINREAFEAFLDSDGEIEFDIYAQNPEDWAALSDLIPGLIVSSAGGVVPFQSEGLLHGHPYYLRSRHGKASLKVGSKDGNAFKDFLYMATIDYEAFVGPERLADMMLKLVPLLEPAHFLWEFEAKKLEFENHEWTGRALDETEIKHAWGFTAEEAYAKTQQPVIFMSEHGISEEKQLAMIKARQINPVPLNQDTRVFPSPAPEFTVNI